MVLSPMGRDFLNCNVPWANSVQVEVERRQYADPRYGYSAAYSQPSTDVTIKLIGVRDMAYVQALMYQMQAGCGLAPSGVAAPPSGPPYSYEAPEEKRRKEEARKESEYAAQVQRERREREDYDMRERQKERRRREERDLVDALAAYSQAAIGIDSSRLAAAYGIEALNNGITPIRAPLETDEQLRARLGGSPVTTVNTVKPVNEPVMASRIGSLDLMLVDEEDEK